MKRLLVIFILLVFTAGFAYSIDFGLLADQKIEVEDSIFSYTAGFTPWFSWNNGKGMSLYLSGNLSLKYDTGIGWSKPALIFDLTRSAFNYRINQEMSLEAGRINYTDTLGFSASGLFDGVRFSTDTSIGNFNAGIFYTGLLYKETAKILMTADDIVNYVKLWDDDIGNYFASQRLLAAVRWDKPLGESSNLYAEVLTQFDLTGNTETLNSQYGMAKIELFPTSKLMITTGALFETSQNNNGDFGLTFGLLAQLKTELPTPLNDSLGLTIKFTSASTSDAFPAFTPINSIPQGAVFPGTLAGLALIGLDYNARITSSLFADCALRYFIRTYNDPSSEGSFHGGEVWASLAWQPFDDVRGSLGVGAFFPVLGNVDIYDSAVLFKLTASLSLSF
ncbi:MAG: hypothetical protein FWD13_08740 [Treponema sp.]|nr:hypothetical protein [Treponema sp.]